MEKTPHKKEGSWHSELFQVSCSTLTEVSKLPKEQKDDDKDKIFHGSEEGRFDFGGKRAMIMDVAGGLYALKKTLRADVGFFEKDFMFRAGMEGARNYLSGIEGALKDKSPREATEMMLGQYSLRGYGDFRIRRFDAEKRILEVSTPNTIEAWAFQSNKDLQRESVCSYVSGVLTLIAKLAFSSSTDEELDISAIEVECAAQGMKECKFIVAPASELPKLIPKFELPRESISEHVLRLNEEILLKNLELQSLNLSLERQVRKRTEELRRSEENYKMLVELSPDPIIICTTEGTMSSINEAGLNMLGYGAHDETEGLNIKSILNESEPYWEKLIWQLEKEGSVHDLEMEFTKRDGRKITGEVSARYAVLPPGRCVETVVRDVTERKIMQAQMIEAKSETEFLNDLLSHDITNFTTSALYFVNSLRKSANLSEEDRRALGVALKDMQGAYELSSSVRDMSRAKMMSEEDMEVKELQSLVVEGIEEAKRMYSERNVRIVFDRSAGPRFIRGNALLSRLFTNLFTNAIKFDPSDEVVIDIDVENEVDRGIAYWRVNIADHGRGIPDGEKDRIFERFHRLDASVPGTGLGLFVVRFIAKACGGRVRAEDRTPGNPSKGTKMVVLLQKATERQVAAVSRR